MNMRKSFLAGLVALPLWAGGSWLNAQEKPAPPAAADPSAPQPPREKDAREKDSREKDSREKDSREKDGRSDDRRSRGEWGGPRFGPPGPPPGDSSATAGSFSQFSADELRQMIEAVQPSNSRLADKMRERFAEAIAKRPTKLSDEQVQAAMSIFQDREPYLVDRLKESLAKDPERVKSMLAWHWPRLEKAIELKKSDRELYDAQTVEILKQGQTRGTFFRLRKAFQEKNEAEATRLQAEVKAQLQEQHKARQAIRKLELARMNDKIKKLSEEITDEEAKSAQVIEKHFNDMLKWAQTPWSRGDRGERPDRPEPAEKREKPE